MSTVLKSFNVRNATLEFQYEERQATMNVVASEDDLKLMQLFNNEKVTVKAELSVKNQSSPASPILNTLTNHFVHSCLQQNYPQLLKHQRYQEVDHLALDILNTD